MGFSFEIGSNDRLFFEGIVDARRFIIYTYMAGPGFDNIFLLNGLLPKSV